MLWRAGSCRWTFALLLVVAGACTAGGGSDATAAVPVPTDSEAGHSESSPLASRWLDADQRRRIDQLISRFENSTTEIQYGYAENIDDGRGVTTGRAGFTTATCDALQVIEIYSDEVGENALSPFVSELGDLCGSGSGETSGLPEASYIDAWVGASGDAAFQAAQDAVVDVEYYEPAMTIADELGLTTAVARAELFDAAVQHGAGSDPDGLPALVRMTNESVGPPSTVGDHAWLAEFFVVRLADLESPFDVESGEAWRESTDRVLCVKGIAASGNDMLDAPISCTVYGQSFTIDE